ncbi:hypothetical protein GF324_03065 [bacterium]|nr:hypothetical protein [bacterium]
MLCRRLLYACAFLFVIGTCSAEWVPPWFSVTLHGSANSNVFADSAETYDTSSSLGLDLAQPLSGTLLGVYSGGIDSYVEYGSLGSHYHDVGFDWYTRPEGLDELWVLGGAYWLFYRDTYALYSKRTFYLDAGASRTWNERTRGRLFASAGRTRYPDSPDTLDVHHEDFSVGGGVNYAFDLPLALDVELMHEARRYFTMDDPRTTSFLVGTVRLSGPLDPRTGFAAELTMREQIDPGQDNLVALYRAGVDPGTLLWDGWAAGATLNHILDAWKLTLDYRYGEYDYSEALPLDFLASREDARGEAMFTAERVLNGGPRWVRPTLVFGYRYVSNRSTYPLYSYTISEFTLTFIVEPR